MDLVGTVIMDRRQRPVFNMGFGNANCWFAIARRERIIEWLSVILFLVFC